MKEENSRMEQEVIDVRDEIEDKERELRRIKRECDKLRREVTMMKEEISIIVPSKEYSKRGKKQIDSSSPEAQMESEFIMKTTDQRTFDKKPNAR